MIPLAHDAFKLRPSGKEPQEMSLLPRLPLQIGCMKPGAVCGPSGCCYWCMLIQPVSENSGRARLPHGCILACSLICHSKRCRMPLGPRGCSHRGREGSLRALLLA